MPISLSLVVEMDNAELAGLGTLLEATRALSGQLDAFAAAFPDSPRPQVVFVLPGDEADAVALREAVARAAPDLAAKAELEFESLPGGRYYELKNRGVAVARGDIVAFLDSDSLPEDGWLPALLAPFANLNVTATSGHTFLDYDDFLSRVYALYWIFPLKSHDENASAKRALNANNCAFRKNWIAANPFPDNPGFKVSCTLLHDHMRKQGVEVKRVQAHARHAPPRGWRFFVWRALVAGRDADRKFKVLKSEHKLRRIANAFGRLLTAEWRSVRRLRLAHHVGIAAWQMPAALAMVTAFNSLSFTGQVLLATGLRRDEIEYVPDYVEHS